MQLSSELLLCAALLLLCALRARLLVYSESLLAVRRVAMRHSRQSLLHALIGRVQERTLLCSQVAHVALHEAFSSVLTFTLCFIEFALYDLSPSLLFLIFLYDIPQYIGVFLS